MFSFILKIKFYSGKYLYTITPMAFGKFSTFLKMQGSQTFVRATFTVALNLLESFTERKHIKPPL